MHVVVAKLGFVETEGFEARFGVPNSWFLQNMSLEFELWELP